VWTERGTFLCYPTQPGELRDYTSSRAPTKDSGPVTSEDIYEVIANVLEPGNLDQLVVYFAGHGVNVRMGEYWLLSDAPRAPLGIVGQSSSRLAVRGLALSTAPPANYLKARNERAAMSFGRQMNHAGRRGLAPDYRSGGSSRVGAGWPTKTSINEILLAVFRLNRDLDIVRKHVVGSPFHIGTILTCA
jgi:hypothetical protein